MSLRLPEHKVLHTIDRIFIKLFSISLGFFRFFRSYFGLQILVLKEFNKTIIPFALVGYETGYRPVRKYHNTLCLSPQILHKHCFCFLLGPL